MRAELPTEDQDLALTIVTETLAHLEDRPMRTAVAFRNALLGSGIIAVNPLLGGIRTQAMRIMNNMIAAVAEGRMIDFGYIPNEVIKATSIAARPLFEANELDHPYENWVGLMAWEGGYNAYYVLRGEEPELLVIELYAVSLPQGDVILVYDAVGIRVENGQTVVTVAPLLGSAQTKKFDIERGSNCLDPVATMLRLLADAAVPVTPVTAPERLNKARVKNGKYAIPAHTLVETKDYVARFAAHAAARGTPQGGHHASPIAHWRRAHPRHLHDGRVVKVKASKVNWRDTEELRRMFYKVPHA